MITTTAPALRHTFRSMVWSVVAVMILTCAAWMGSGSTNVARAAACDADVFFIGARGSGEAPGYGGVVGGAYEALKKDLAADNYTIKGVPLDYPAGFYLALATGKFDDSLDKGVSAAVTQFKSLGKTLARPECASAKVVLAGYSQGAMVMHLALLEIAYSGDKDYQRVLERLTGAILVADGYKVGSDSGIVRLGAGASSGRDGIGTPKNYNHFPAHISGKVFSVCELGDAVCDPWWVTGAVGMPIHGESYRLSGAKQSTIMKSAVSRVSMETELALHKSKPKPVSTTVQPKPAPPAPVRPTVPVRPPTIPSQPVQECVPVPPPWSEGDCLAEVTFGVGQPLQENAYVFWGYGDYVYVLDAASAAAVRDLGYVLSEDGTMVSGSARKTGSIVMTVVGTAPDGSVVRYRAKLNVVENQSAKRVAEAVASGEKVMSPPHQEPPTPVLATTKPALPLDESVTPDTESDEPSSEPLDETTAAQTPDPVEPKDATGGTSEVDRDREPADEPADESDAEADAEAE